MRRLVIGLFFTGFAVGACSRPSDTAAPATGKETAQPSAFAVATSGTAEPARDKTLPERTVTKTVVREVTIPEGTELPIILDTAVGSKTSRTEEPVRAHLSRTVSLDGKPVLADGTIVNGVVTDATPSAKVKGRAHLAVRFDSITPRGGDERYRMETASIGRTAPETIKNDALKIGGPAAGGAIIGALIGGGKGAAIGAAAGGGAGTAVVLSTGGKETNLPAGSALRLRLAAPLTIRIRG